MCSSLHTGLGPSLGRDSIWDPMGAMYRSQNLVAHGCELWNSQAFAKISTDEATTAGQVLSYSYV